LLLSSYKCDHLWGCPLLGDYNSNAIFSPKFLLIIEGGRWDLWARKYALFAGRHYHIDQDYPQYLEEAELLWQTIFIRYNIDSRKKKAGIWAEQ
jgi:hypothetical protein